MIPLRYTVLGTITTGQELETAGTPTVPRTTARVALAVLVVTMLALLTLPGCACSSSSEEKDGEGFAIYLLADGITPSDLATLSHLTLKPPALVSENDVISYDRATHEIELTPAAYDLVWDTDIPLTGRPFAVCVNGAPVYAGAFITPLWSGSFSGVAIVHPMGSDPVSERHVIQLELGYPGASFFTGADPRDDPAVFEALSRTAKLR